MNDYSKTLLLKSYTVIPWYFLLTEEENRLLLNNLNTIKYARKDVIFKQDTLVLKVMFIKSGFVKVYKKGRNDKNIIFNIYKEGDYINLFSVFGEINHSYSAGAITDVIMCEIDMRIFKSIVFKNEKYNAQLFQLVSREGLNLFEKLMNQSQKQLPGKVADILLFFSEHIFKNKVFSFPLSRKELADIAGTTKESLIRTLTEFKNDRIIELSGSKIEIKSMDIVKTLSLLG